MNTNKEKMKKLIENQNGIEHVPVTDEDAEFFLKALLGDYKGPGYRQE